MGLLLRPFCAAPIVRNTQALHMMQNQIVALEFHWKQQRVDS